MDNLGNIRMKLLGVDVPIKINNGAVEVCSSCGGLTISGIYELKNNDEIEFTDNGDGKYELELNTPEEDTYE